MKKILFLVVILMLVVFFGCEKLGKMAEDKTVTKQDLQNDEAKESYAIGLDMASNLKNRGFEIDARAFFAGFNAGLTGSGSLLSEEEKQSTLMAMQTKMMQKMQEEMGKKAAENKARGEAFLEENKTKEGVKVTESGLQYIVKKEGSGAKPSAEDVVEVHYRGALLDGTEFDSSYERGQTVKFPLNRVIPGWTEGLQLMSPGAKYKFFVHSDLAYGDQGNNRIAPGETLVFDVELISFEKAPQK